MRAGPRGVCARGGNSGVRAHPPRGRGGAGGGIPGNSAHAVFPVPENPQKSCTICVQVGVGGPLNRVFCRNSASLPLNSPEISLPARNSDSQRYFTDMKCVKFTKNREFQGKQQHLLLFGDLSGNWRNRREIWKSGEKRRKCDKFVIFTYLC